jgi:hypothetical protein
MTPIDLAWAAGVFEGEGSIRINTPTKRNFGSLLADMVNTDRQITQVFADAWGGYHREVPSAGERQAFWRWRIAALQAAAFLREIEPFIRTDKYRERIRLGLEFQAQKSSLHAVCRAPEYRLMQRNYYERMAMLNLRGVRDQPTAVRMLS